MTLRFQFKCGSAVLLLCAAISGASAQAPPTGPVNPPVWSSHDRQLYRFEEGRPAPIVDPAADGTDHSSPQYGVICQPQTVFGLTPFLLSEYGTSETTGSAR